MQAGTANVYRNICHEYGLEVPRSKWTACSYLRHHIPTLDKRSYFTQKVVFACVGDAPGA